MNADTTPELADRLESIRRAMAVVAADRPTPEQIAEWNTADKEMAQRIRAALPGVPLHHAYAVLQALRVTERLDAAAVSVAVPPVQERRDRYAKAIAGTALRPPFPHCLAMADAVLAVADAEQADTRAAALREAVEEMKRDALGVIPRLLRMADEAEAQTAAVLPQPETQAGPKVVARVAALHQPMQRGALTVCAHCSHWDEKRQRCFGVLTDYPCDTVRALGADEQPAVVARPEEA